MSGLSKAQAMRAYKKVCKALQEKPVEQVFVQDGRGWPRGPVLVKDFQLWSSPTAWAVVWEEGPYDWPFGLTGGFSEIDWLVAEETGKAPTGKEPLEIEGIFLEPTNSWAMGIYSA